MRTHTQEKAAPPAGRGEVIHLSLGKFIAELTQKQDISYLNDLPRLPTADTSRVALLQRLQVHRRTAVAISATRGEDCEAVVEDCLLPERVVGTSAFWVLAPWLDVRSGERSGHTVAPAVAQRFNRFGAAHYVRLVPGWGLEPESRSRLTSRAKVLISIDDRAGAGPEAFAPKTLSWALHDLPRGRYDLLAVVAPQADHLLYEGQPPRRDKTGRMAAVVVLAGAKSADRWLAAIARGALAGGRHAAR